MIQKERKGKEAKSPILPAEEGSLKIFWRRGKEKPRAKKIKSRAQKTPQSFNAERALSRQKEDRGFLASFHKRKKLPHSNPRSSKFRKKQEESYKLRKENESYLATAAMKRQAQREGET